MRTLSPEQFASLAEPLDDSPSVPRLIALVQQCNPGIGVFLVKQGATVVYHSSYMVALPQCRAIWHD